MSETITREQVQAEFDMATFQAAQASSVDDMVNWDRRIEICKIALKSFDQPAPFQQRVNDWTQACFGAEISADKSERNHRFLEEALELVQAIGCSKSEAHQLVDYVYDRPQGDVNQEVGGVMVTLAALCLANGVDMQAGGETELVRVWTKIEKIRAKQAAKPKHSPLPAPPASQEVVEMVAIAIHGQRKASGYSGAALWEHEPQYIHDLYRGTAQAAICALSETGLLKEQG